MAGKKWWKGIILKSSRWLQQWERTKGSWTFRTEIVSHAFQRKYLHTFILQSHTHYSLSSLLLNNVQNYDDAIIEVAIWQVGERSDSSSINHACAGAREALWNIELSFVLHNSPDSNSLFCKSSINDSCTSVNIPEFFSNLRNYCELAIPEKNRNSK